MTTYTKAEKEEISARTKAYLNSLDLGTIKVIWIGDGKGYYHSKSKDFYKVFIIDDNEIKDITFMISFITSYKYNERLDSVSFDGGNCCKSSYILDSILSNLKD